MRKNYLFTCIVLSVLATASTSARAELIYGSDSLTDTSAGLVWTRGLLPTATFISPAGSTVASDAQFRDLVGQLGVAPNPFGLPRPYSAAIAKLATWGTWAYFYAGPESGAQCNGPNGGGNCFLGMELVYQPQDGNLWLAYVVQTISRYGPTFSNPPSGWEQEFVPTLFVRPVPLPAGLWLTISALAVVGMKRRRNLVGQG